MNELFPYKYRPFFLRDFYLDPNTQESIQGLIRVDKLKILIQGQPNTGKTSLLYAILREYYSLSPSDTIPENEVLFVNNLKEQGITFFRQEIKFFCQSRSSSPHRKKCVVIDDLDLIHLQCQQILCNYMDKYESQIHFLFACNNRQKITEGLQSRVFCTLLSPPRPEDMSHLYDKIVCQENLLAQNDLPEKEAIKTFLIDNANGNFRELVNCLGKIKVYLEPGQVLNIQICKGLFLTRIYQSFTDYLAFIKQGRLREAIQVMKSILTNGYSIMDIFDYFFKFLKFDVTITQLDEIETYEIIKILCTFIHIVHTTHEDNIELFLFTNRLYRLLRPVQVEKEIKGGRKKKQPPPPPQCATVKKI